jgi:hypothetical protein
VARSLRAEDRQRRGDAVQDALEVDVDHLLPVLDAQRVQGRDRHHAGVVDQHVQAPEALTGQLDERGHVLAPAHVGGHRRDRAAVGGDAGSHRLQARGSAGPEHDAGAALGQQLRSRLADPAAGPRDGDDLLLDAAHALAPVLCKRAIACSVTALSHAPTTTATCGPR